MIQNEKQNYYSKYFYILHGPDDWTLVKDLEYSTQIVQTFSFRRRQI